MSGDVRGLSRDKLFQLIRDNEREYIRQVFHPDEEVGTDEVLQSLRRRGKFLRGVATTKGWGLPPLAKMKDLL